MYEVLKSLHLSLEPQPAKTSSTPPCQWGSSAQLSSVKWMEVFGGGNCAWRTAEGVQVWWKHRNSNTPAGNVKSKGQIPMPLAEVWREGHLQGPGISPSCLQTIPWNRRAGLWILPAVPEAPEEIHLCLSTHRAENTPHTRNAPPLCGAQQLCLPSAIYPAKEEFSSTSHSFPHQQEPIQAARHEQQTQKCQAKTFLLLPCCWPTRNSALLLWENLSRVCRRFFLYKYLGCSSRGFPLK